MSRNRARNTTPERLLRRALVAQGVRGYRLNAPGVPGRPDIAFTRARLAVFVHGCFWHRCPTCDYALPKSNTEFWRAKFARNKERDARKVRDLQRAGWRTLTLWECRVKKDPDAAAARVIRKLGQRVSFDHAWTGPSIRPHISHA